jgi:predicted dehydrogenase
VVKVAILGFGFMGRTHLEAYRSLPSVEVVNIGDPNAGSRLQDVPNSAGIYSDLERLVRETKADVIDVCLPTFLHEKYVLLAAQRGLHVLCEKPLALTVAEADRMLEATNKAGTTFMVAQVLRFFSHYTKVKELVTSGEIGQPIFAAAARLSEPPQWAKWFQDPAKGGGALFDLQIHDLDYLLNLFGLPNSLMTSGVRSGSGCWDQVMNVLSYADKQIAIESSYRMPIGWPFTSTLRITGTTGAIEYRFRVQGNVDQAARAQHELVLYRNGKPTERFDFDDPDPYVREIQYFIECVENRTEPSLVRPRDCRNAIAVLESSLQSLVTGSPVSLAHLQQEMPATATQGSSANASH